MNTETHTGNESGLSLPPHQFTIDPVDPVSPNPVQRAEGGCGCGCACFCGSGNQTHLSSDDSQSTVQVTFIAQSLVGNCSA